MASEVREYLRFAFYRFTESWRALDSGARGRALDELAVVLEDKVAPWQLCYSLAGLRADADFGVWLKTAEGVGPLQEFERRIRGGACGDHLVLAYNFISMTKPSPYASPETDPEREKLRAYAEGAPYVFVYPMVKTRAWYALPAEERGKLMREHVAVGRKYPQIRINTSYSYGIDDQEFIVAFEGGDPAEFLDLVQDLRYTRASQYTLRDTPMFTCVLRSPRELAREFAPGRSPPPADAGFAGEAAGHEDPRTISHAASHARSLDGGDDSEGARAIRTPEGETVSRTHLTTLSMRVRYKRRTRACSSF